MYSRARCSSTVAISMEPSVRWRAMSRALAVSMTAYVLLVVSAGRALSSSPMTTRRRQRLLAAVTWPLMSVITVRVWAWGGVGGAAGPLAAQLVSVLVTSVATRQKEAMNDRLIFSPPGYATMVKCRHARRMVGRWSA